MTGIRHLKTAPLKIFRQALERLSPIIFAPATLLLTGCRFDAHSPTVDVLGSYFPAWMMCIILGLAATLVTRQVLIATRIDLYLRFAALVYTSVFLFFTLSIWLIFFQN